MKLNHLPLTILFILSFLPACGAQNEWTTYHAASETVVNPNFPAYAFEYPSGWTMEEGVDHITFVSETKLLKDVPEKLNKGQIMAGLSLNLNMLPGEMVDTYASTHKDMIQFQETVSTKVNDRPAAYREGVNPETGDQTFVVAVDMGENTRALLTSRIAAGELQRWRETLFKIVESLRVEDDRSK